jgi:hypothetical protein
MERFTNRIGELRAMMSLSPHAQEIFDASMDWMDSLFDGEAGLLWQPQDASSTRPFTRHMVRDSTYYALGLLMRDGLGDRQRAEQVLSTILDQQIDEPEAPYHGTFLRAPEEPRPGGWAREWRDYDPNWRDFVGTGFALILTHFEDELDSGLVARMDAAFRLAITGALARHLNPAYTNIALMDAYLLHYVGVRQGVQEWQNAGEAFATQVYEIFQRHDAFEEYNSPTYYGPDLYALGLWRRYTQSVQLRERGAEMETKLWLDIARFYHAGLRNQCGPWDRSYGMDMTRYVALLGMWIWLATGRASAPFPTLRETFYHSGDLCFGPLAALVGTHVPAEALPHLLAFQGARRVEQRITGDRMASAWLEERFMLGAEHTQRGKNGYNQFHPLTIHWRMPDGQVGWAKLVHTIPVDVAASERQLSLSGQGTMQFEVYSPGAVQSDIQTEHWALNGLNVNVEGACGPCEVAADEQNQGILTITYPAPESQEIQMRFMVS